MAPVLTTPPVAEAGSPVDGGILGRVWHAPRWAHAVVLVVLLGLAMGYVGTSTSFNNDEGAAILQARTLSSGQGWTRHEALPSIDVDGTGLFYINAESGPNGFTTLGRHPLYPLLLAAADRVAGVNGMILLSVLGTVVAALGAAALTARWRPGLEPWTFWAVGMSPLFFAGLQVVAGTLAAGLAALAALLVVRLLDRWRPLDAVLVVAACLAASLLRSEMMFFAVAVGVAAIAHGLAEHSRRWMALGVAAGAAAVVENQLDKWWLVQILGASPSQVPLSSPPTDFLEARSLSFFHTILYPVGPEMTSARLGLVVLVLVPLLGAVVWRLHLLPATAVPAVAVVLVGAALYVVLAQPVEMVPGLLVACPVVAAGVLLIDRALVSSPTGRFLAITSGGFVLAILATQYAQGGSYEWGARYFGPILPVAVPLCVAARDQAGRRLSASARRVAWGSLVACTVLLTFLGLRYLQAYHRSVADDLAVVRATVEATPPVAIDGAEPRPLVLTTIGGWGRWAWPIEPSNHGILVMEPDQQCGYLQRAHDAGVRDLVVVAGSSGLSIDACRDLYRIEWVRPPGHDSISIGRGHA